MAKVSETVEVKFTADTAEYDKSVGKSSEGTNNFAASVGSVVSGTILAGAALLKFNAVLKFFNFEIAKNLKSFALFNVTYQSLAGTIWKNLIPAFIKLRIAIVSSGVGALVLVLLSLIAVLGNTVKGSDFLSTILKTLGNVVKGLVEVFTGFGKILIGLFSGDWARVTEGWAQAWEGVAVGIGNAWSQASKLVAVLRQITNFAENAATRTQGLAQTVLDMTAAIAVLGDAELAAIVISKARLRIQEQIIVNKLIELDLEAATLKIGKETEDSRKRLDEIAAERAALQVQRTQQRNDNANFITEVNANISAKKRQAQTIRIDEQTAEMVQAIAFASQEITDANLLGLHTDFLNNKLVFDEQYFIDRAALEANIAKRTADLNVRLAREENIAKFDTAVTFGRQVADLGVELAGDNRAVQGALLISQAVAQTALNILKVATEGPLAIAAMAILGATQIAAIANAMKVPADNAVAIQPNFNTPIDRLETSSPDFFRSNQSITQPQQPILVVEDYVKASNRVAVKESRASLG